MLCKTGLQKTVGSGFGTAVLCGTPSVLLTRARSALNTLSFPFACSGRREKQSLRRRRLSVRFAIPTDTGTGGGGCPGHLHVHPGGVEGAVPVHR